MNTKKPLYNIEDVYNELMKRMTTEALEFIIGLGPSNFSFDEIEKMWKENHTGTMFKGTY